MNYANNILALLVWKKLIIYIIPLKIINIFSDLQIQISICTTIMTLRVDHHNEKAVKKKP